MRVHLLGVPADVAPVLLVMITQQTRRLRREQGRDEQRIDGGIDPDTQPSSKPDPEQLFGRAEGCDDARGKVEAILARMSADAVEVFRLIDINGVPPEQVAEALDRPVGTIAVQLHRARIRFWDLAARLHNVRPGGST